ncbi:MAG: hypothetical protein ABIN94_07835 [Ferruginibacter sp.]
MRRLFVLLSSLLLIIGAHSCKKNELIVTGITNTLVDSSRSFFEKEVLFRSSGLPADNSLENKKTDPGKFRNKLPIWEKASEVLTSTGAAVIVPIRFAEPYLIQNNFSGKNVYSSDDINQLLIYKDKTGTFHAEKLTFLPDSNYVNLKGHAFTGIISVETWAGDYVNRFKYESNGKIQRYLGSVSSARTPVLAATEMTILTFCYQSSGYNYAANDPNNGTYWTQNLGCQQYFIDDTNTQGNSNSPTGTDYGAAGGGGSPGGSSSSNTFSLLNGDNPINNIIQYTKCFTNTPGSGNTYSVTVCVEQPQPGSRETWGFSGSGSSADNNPISVGHTFLILNQTNSLGSTIRNVGFYPAYGATPLSPQSRGQINNDANHDYDISLTISMDNSQFFQVVNYINLWAESALIYDLNSNNCTTFALNALATAGINLPRTPGSWLNGGGLNPGDLGEDIRTMNLPSNMSKTTLSGTHPNIGVCY